MSALLLMVSSCAAYAIGWRVARRWPRVGEVSGPGEATLAILGLLLAFTFSLALSQHNSRREWVVADANSIGDFYTCATLLDEPYRGRLQATIRQYLEHRLKLARTRMSRAELEEELGRIAQMHEQMATLVRDAVNAGTPVVVPLVNTLNELTSNHTSRVASLRYRLPWSIELVLTLSAVLAFLMMGLRQGESGELNLLATASFLALVCLIIWVILDLNQPGRGAIRVSQDPLERILSSMGR